MNIGRIRNLYVAILAISLAACAPGRAEQPTVGPEIQNTAAPAASTGMVTTIAETAPTETALATPGGGNSGFGPVVGQGTVSQITPTPLPSQTSTPGGPTPAFGPIIGPNYTPPPTLTPNPSPTFTTGTLPPPFTPGPSPTPGPVLRADLMGIQIHGFLTDAEFSNMLDRAQQLGIKWIKVQVDWSLFEPVKGQFNDFYRGRVLNVQRASIRGFRTMVSFAKAPDWARPVSVRGIEAGPPDNPQDMADFVGRFVRDTKPEFIDAIEIWNEANLIREWRGKPINGGTYMAYFQAAYEAIQNEQRAQPSALKPNHRITVITAGPAPTVTFGNGSTMGDREWIQQLYDNGLAKYGQDVALGAHPYGWGNAPDARCCQAAPGVTGWYEHPSFYFRETLDSYRQIMQQNNHTAGKIWVTEFGWATYDGLRRSDGSPASADPRVGWQGFLNQGQQADYVLRAFHLAQQPPYYDYLGPMILWNLNFSLVPKMIDEGRDEVGFSLLDGGGNPRPAFIALASTPKQ